MKDMKTEMDRAAFLAAMSGRPAFRVMKAVTDGSGSAKAAAEEWEKRMAEGGREPAWLSDPAGVAPEEKCRRFDDICTLLSDPQLSPEERLVGVAMIVLGTAVAWDGPDPATEGGRR